MKRYYNRERNAWHTEGRSLTLRTAEGRLFSGVPTEEQLMEWGYEPYEEPTPIPPSEEELAARERRGRMAAIERELGAMDYLTSKEADGEDMSEYNEKYDGDWHAYRRNLREQYRDLETEQAAYEAALNASADAPNEADAPLN